VISTWTGNPVRYLGALCDSMSRYPAGIPYDLILCANGVEYCAPADLKQRFAEIFVRENVGYNLGAWDHVWRRLPSFDRFLFLQDDCIVLKKGWLRDFMLRFESTPSCGLVGENLLRAWDRPWTELCDPRTPFPRDGDSAHRAARARFFRETLAAWGIQEGERALFISTVVQFTSRSILEKVNGYNIGLSKEEAAAAEIGFSRKIASLGYRLVQIGPRRHSRIAHPQWPSDAFFPRLKRSIGKRLPWPSTT
jgi:hypothetical protein